MRDLLLEDAIEVSLDLAPVMESFAAHLQRRSFAGVEKNNTTSTISTHYLELLEGKLWAIKTHLMPSQTIYRECKLIMFLLGMKNQLVRRQLFVQER